MYLQCEKETAIKPSRTCKTCDKALLPLFRPLGFESTKFETYKSEITENIYANVSLNNL